MIKEARHSQLHRVGRLAIAAGTVFAAAGGAAWFAVTKELRDERITVPGNAPVLAGKLVQDPATAYVQALVIKRNAERSAGGRTFADISAELQSIDGSSDKARELRNQSAALSTAASLRTALMTSVLAYGVSTLVAGLGALSLLVGSLMRRPDEK